MNNYIYKIAKNNIQKDKKFYQYIFISIFLTISIVLCSHILLESTKHSTYLESTMRYGEWDIACMNMTEEVEEIKKDPLIKDIGKFYFSGDVIEKKQYLGYIGSFDEDGLKLANLQLKEGHFAYNENEVVVEEAVQKEMKWKLNQELTIHYSYNHQMTSKNFKLVGIIKTYSANWKVRAPTFITQNLPYHETDILATSKNVQETWDHDASSGQYIKNLNIHPEVQWMDEYVGYTNESTFAQNFLEITILSMIVVMITMMSSLNKRESQLVMFRSIGMTYKQLKRLILYEGFILACIAGFLAIVFSFILSAVIMFIYSITMPMPFSWNIDIVSLSIELIVCVLALGLGIFLPTLTVYDLPLTRKNGEYTYHPHRKKIRKPTFLSLTLEQFHSHMGYHILIIMLTVFIVVEASSVVIFMKEHILSISENHQTYFSWDGYIVDYPFKDNSHIHLNSIRDMWVVIGENGSNYSLEVRLICIDHDEEVKQAIHYHELKDNEYMILCPQSYSKKFEKEIDFRKYDENNEGIVPFLHVPISKIVYLDKSIEREYLKFRNGPFVTDSYAIVVNSQTFCQFAKKYHYFNNEEDINKDNNFVIYTDRDIDDIQVHNYFIKNNYGFLINKSDDIYMKLYGTQRSLIGTAIYSTLLFITSIMVLYLMRLLLSDQKRKELGIFNIIGMTKKNIYLMYTLQYTLMYIISIMIASIYWYAYSCEAVVYTFLINIRIYIICSLVIYVVYLICILLPIHHIFKQKSLNLIDERIQ